MRRLQEFNKRRQNSGADAEQYAQLDGQLLFHFLDVAFQFVFGYLKFMFQGEFQFLQRLSVGGLVLVKLVF